MNKNKKVFIMRMSVVVLIMLVILLVWNGCNQKARLSAYKKEMNKLTWWNQSFIEQKTKDNKVIVEQSQIILSQKDAIKNHLLELDGLKKIKSQVKIKSVFQVDSVFVPYTDTFYIEQTKYHGFIFALNDKSYSIFGKTKENGILIDSLSFKNDLNITIGNKSRGFFRASEPIVKVEYQNPYISTKSIQNVVVKNDVKWWDRKGTWLGIGIISGFVGGLFIK